MLTRPSLTSGWSPVASASVAHGTQGKVTTCVGLTGVDRNAASGRRPEPGAASPDTLAVPSSTVFLSPQGIASLPGVSTRPWPRSRRLERPGLESERSRFGPWLPHASSARSRPSRVLCPGLGFLVCARGLCRGACAPSASPATSVLPILVIHSNVIQSSVAGSLPCDRRLPPTPSATSCSGKPAGGGGPGSPPRGGVLLSPHTSLCSRLASPQLGTLRARVGEGSAACAHCPALLAVAASSCARPFQFTSRLMKIQEKRRSRCSGATCGRWPAHARSEATGNVSIEAEAAVASSDAGHSVSALRSPCRGHRAV